MLGVIFAFAILIGLVLGAIPGVISLIVFIKCSIKRKQPLSTLLYIAAVVICEFSLLALSSKLFDCGMTSKGLGECFSLYIYLGASPGLSVTVGLFSLLLDLKKAKV